ncbi:TetR/AcrR family transcriptional regulator [Paenibacillus lautus]|uniref:TetR/AcrR family transcriptional regulator n=1 Tax=Paenibacillus lautus TaxID=1401 RepID=A0A2A5LF84_PAELA|nr:MULTISPECIES: TetR/AcrR family transcriptional regulator [Paenibacillus]MBY0160935.1 TetR/AcrR family transcriptional regulator [Cytobacillus firmus]VTR23666.1 HTH-type transcriptional repressor Bm3R1 [Actinobacillus pleuropneumoniae]ACX67566.1 transcriptional regulator, TetR family [Paenibacillus sp. Y412MC10]AYB42365.1 TetR/AcrR family transcriptional regulator [Paenibacillus lautus]ETT58730.1 TetR family transcriptional regulator [Paenibacillus sp. FSL H8-457]
MPAVDRRKQVLDAASKSFALFGYKATTMEQVAKIANVGKGTIYTFFTNKDELFDEILLSAIMEMKRLAEREIRKDRDFFDNLYRVLDALLEFRSEHELFIKLSQEVRDIGTPKAHEGLTKVENGIVGYLKGIVENAISIGEIKPLDAQVVSFVMLKLYVALTTDFNQLHKPLSKEQIKEYMMVFLADGLKASS